jgi:membrane protease YdiL (CAAX protease family)
MQPPFSIPPKRYSLLAFFLLAFGISWVFWVPTALDSRGLISFPVSSTFPLAAFGPTLAALILTTILGRWAGLRALLGRLFIWRVGVLWYVFALLYPPAISLATTALYVLFGGEAPDFSNPPILRGYPLPPEVLEIGPLVLLPIFFLTQLLISSPMGEEIGWRGYALPRLQATRSALMTSVILVVLWQLWHVPKMVAEGMTLSEAFSPWGYSAQ